MKLALVLFVVLLSTLHSSFSTAFAFEGRIHATLMRGGEVQTFLFTVGTNQLRIERGETNWPHAKNIVNLDSGAITLLFPHNRSFVRLKNSGTGVPPVRFNGGQTLENEKLTGGTPVPPPPLFPHTPPPPPMPAGIGPTNIPGMPLPPPMPAMPAAGGMPSMPMMPLEQAELKATGETTNLLGYVCTRYELKQRGEMMEIWATDKLLPFQPYLQNQPPRFGPRMMEEQWPEMMKSKKLFPLLAVMKFENGPERMHFEVKTITPEKIEDRAGSLFQPPTDYQEIEPLPF